jgi:AraC-like DNA-binding protein
MYRTAIRYRPAPPLGCFVRIVWYYEHAANYAAPHLLERVLPDGAMGIVINLDCDLTRIYDPNDTTRLICLSGSVAMGARSACFVIDTAEQRSVLGVQFLPGGASPFLRVPADEILNRHLSLEDIWGPEGRALRERILQVADPHERCRFLERELLRGARGRLEMRPEVAFGVASLDDGSQTVASLARATGLSGRRFSEVFRISVGMTPKAYARTRRFQTALRRIEHESDPDWSAIALECGYFDQAHFNHDFREFSGINPSTYLAKKTKHLNHVPI